LRSGTTEQAHQTTESIFALLPAGAQNAAQDLLHPGPVPGAVTTPDFPRDDDAPQRPFGCIIGGVQARALQKSEQIRLLVPQMIRQPDIGQR
jgi:hypothetical protein